MASPALPARVVPDGRRPRRGPPPPRPRDASATVELLFLAPAVAYLLLFFGYPIVKNVVMGFQHYTTRRSSPASRRGWGWTTTAR